MVEQMVLCASSLNGKAFALGVAEQRVFQVPIECTCLPHHKWTTQGQTKLAMDVRLAQEAEKPMQVPLPDQHIGCLSLSLARQDQIVQRQEEAIAEAAFLKENRHKLEARMYRHWRWPQVA